MAKEKNSALAARLRLQKGDKDQPSILQDEEKQWSWTRILIFVLLIYAGMSFMHGCFSIIDLKAQQNAIVAQTEEAQATQDDLENEVSYMQTNEAIEKIAREDLNMVKPGEILLTQRENKDADSQTAQASDDSEG